MYIKIYILVCVYFFLYACSNFVKVEALVGDNVRPANENEFPFIVAIAKYILQRDLQINYFCAGSLITRKDVLTSEHCLLDKHVNGVQILVGSSYLDVGTRYYPSWWFTYDQWAVRNHLALGSDPNDVAILNLISRVQHDIVPAHIYIASMESLIGLEVKVAGWGLLRNASAPNTLQVGTVTILSKEACERRVSQLAGEDIDCEGSSICTIGNPYVLLRPGDSGGPLFYNNLLVGINFGTSPFPAIRIHPRQVNVHEHITYYYDFISDVREDE